MRIEWMEQYMANAEKLITENHVEEGMSILRNLLFEEPGYSGLHNHLGWAYMYFSNDVGQAEMHFEMAIKFDPNFAPPYLHLGSLLNRSGRYSAAIDHFNKGLRAVNANRVALYEGLAIAYEMKRDFRKAIKFYKVAIASSVGFEFNHLQEGIKRCRSKRWVLMFS